MFVAGNIIKIGENSNIGRDAYVVGSNVEIDTDIARDLHIGADKINLSGTTIGGDAYIASNEIIFDENTLIKGKLSYPKKAIVKGLSLAHISTIEQTEYEEVDTSNVLLDNIIEFIVSVVTSFITLIIILKLIPFAN